MWVQSCDCITDEEDEEILMDATSELRRESKQKTLDFAEETNISEDSTLSKMWVWGSKGGLELIISDDSWWREWEYHWESDRTSVFGKVEEIQWVKVALGIEKVWSGSGFSMSKT